MIASESGGALTYEAALALPYSRLLQFANDLANYRTETARKAKEAALRK